jgi:hypothetical protein
MTCLRSSNGERNWPGSDRTSASRKAWLREFLDRRVRDGVLRWCTRSAQRNRDGEEPCAGNSLGRVCGGAGGQPPALHPEAGWVPACEQRGPWCISSSARAAQGSRGWIGTGVAAVGHPVSPSPEAGCGGRGRARGGIGRRAGLRIQWSNPCRFKSCRAHHHLDGESV